MTTLRSILTQIEAGTLVGAPQRELRVAGSLVPGYLSGTVDMGTDQLSAQATFYVTARPAGADELQAVTWDAGFNGYLARCFTGEIYGFDWQYFPTAIGLLCRGKLGHIADDYGGDDITWSSALDTAIISDILTAYGNTEQHLDSSGWTGGTIDPILLSKNRNTTRYTNGAALIQEIDRMWGYYTYDGPDGATYRRRNTGNASPPGVWYYAQGVNIDTGAKRVRKIDSGVYNECDIIGLTYNTVAFSGSASAANAYIPPSPGFILSPLNQCPLLESDADCASVAQREVGDNNRRPEGLVLPVCFNPLLQPTATVHVRHTALETGDAYLFIKHIQHRDQNGILDTTLTTTGGTLSGYNASAPQVQFDTLVLLENEIGVGAVYVIVATSRSFDPDGDETLMTRAWSVAGTGGTPSPTTGTGVVFRTVIPATATSINITETDTDQTGLVSVLTKTIALTQASAMREDVYGAAGTLALCTSDGEQTMKSQTIPASATTSCCAEYAPPDYQAWGASNGHVYLTFNKLRSALVDAGQPCGTSAEITAVWPQEQDETRLWAANSAGLVAFGLVDVTAQTVAWVVAGTIPEGPVKEIRESYGLLGELRATAGTGYYYSADGGVTWIKLMTFDTAWRMAAGWFENLASGLNDSLPLRSEAGTAVTLPVLSPTVTHIRGLTAGYQTTAYYLADNHARLFQSHTDTTADLLNFDYALTNASGVNHMVRSGNVDGKIYMACDNGIYCWLPGIGYVAKLYASGDAVTMVGVGLLHPQEHQTTVNMLRPTSGAVAGGGGIYARKGSAAPVLSNAGLPANRAWTVSLVNPADTTVWIAWDGGDGLIPDAGSNEVRCSDGTHPLWVCTDEVNWTAVPVRWTHVFDYGWAAPTVCFDSYGRLVITMWRDDGGGGYNAYWRADPTSGDMGLPILIGSAGDASITRVVDGLGGDIVDWRDVAGPMRYVAGGSATDVIPADPATIQVHFSTAERPELVMERLIVGADLSRAVAGFNAQSDGGTYRFLYTPDYSMVYVMPYTITNIAGLRTTGIAATGDSLYLSCVFTGGIYRLDDVLTGTATLVQVVTGDVGFLRSARNARTSACMVGRYSATGYLAVYDGAWTTQSDWPATTYASWIEPWSSEVAA